MNVYSKLLKNIVLPIGDLVNRSSYRKDLLNIQKEVEWSEEALVKLGENRLEKILSFTSTSVPYYKKKGLLRRDDENIYDWLGRFPILKKKDVAENLNELLTVPKKGLISYSSSGSSGNPGTVYMDKNEQSRIRAIQTLWWMWAGYDLGKPMVQIGATPKRGVLKGMKDFFFRTKYISAFEHTNVQIQKLFHELGEKNGYFFGGYASSLFSVAQIAEKEGVSNFRFDSAVSWGDKLFPHYKAKIKEVFGVEVKDTYGCNEGLLIAAQKDLDFYYIMSPHVHLELVNSDGQPVPDGELGHVVVTRLDNYSMPLVRYWNGDLAVKLPRNRYPHQRNLKLPLLERVVGRETDIVLTRSGQILVVHFFTGIFEFIKEIKQFRVIQRNLDGIEIEIISGRGYSKDILIGLEKQLLESIRDKGFQIRFKEVEEIMPTKSGKPQLIESLIDLKI